MGAVVSYMLQVGIVMSLFFLVYKWLLGTTTFYKMNRVLLMAIYFFSWLFPALLRIELSTPQFQNVSVEIGLLQSVDVTEIRANSFPWVNIVLWVYVAGALITAFFAFIGLIRLRNIVASGTCSREDGVIRIITPLAPGPFCWFNRIVLRPGDLGASYDLIIAHERAHLTLHHWFDLVIAQVTIILQWFSPAAWLMMRSLKDNHEFQVDSMVAGDDPLKYQLMLIKMTVGSRFPVLADSLNHSQIKKRLTMMMTKKSSGSRRFATLALPAAAVVALVALSQPSVARVSDILGNASMIPETVEKSVSHSKINDSPAVVQEYIDVARHEDDRPLSLSSNSEDTSVLVSSVESSVSDSPASVSDTSEEKPAVFIDGVLFTGDLSSIPSDDVESMYVVKNDPLYPQGKIMVFTKKVASESVGDNQGKVYLKTETVAEYKGGMPALMDFLATHITCPDEVKTLTRVIVSFTIETDGSVKDVKVVKSGGDLCDTEAVKAVEETSGNWIPGRNNGTLVASKFTLPVNFRPYEEKKNDTRTS